MPSPSVELGFGALQVLVTFCVLNMVVAIILNAFTWCYSLEPSEITSELFVNSRDLLHFGVREAVGYRHLLGDSSGSVIVLLL